MHFLLLRYSFQDFVDVRKSSIDTFLKLKRWHDPDMFETLLTDPKHQLSRKTMVVPTVSSQNRHLRLKTVTCKERNVLRGLQRFERLEHNGLEYYFGTEPVELNHPHAYGVAVSVWGKDPVLTKFQLTYDFLHLALATYGPEGFGSRGSVTSGGLNVYCKAPGRGFTKAIPSPAQAAEEAHLQQYYRQTQPNMLCQPTLRAQLNELVTDALHFGRTCNNYLMGMVGYICTRQILTAGHIPKKALPSYSELFGGSLSPCYGFWNSSHVDCVDMLSQQQLQEWRELAKGKKWHYCQKLLARNDFCLPTTCGYQFLYKGDDTHNQLEVKAMFAMEGLGMAVQLEHGIGHHFMGAWFSHCTCLPVCESNGLFSVTNHEDNFSIIGWGGTGGRKEVAESSG